jgi:hypothetical protein
MLATTAGSIRRRSKEDTMSARDKLVERNCLRAQLLAAAAAKRG